MTAVAKHTPLPWVIIQADTERMEIDNKLVGATGGILIGKYGYRMTIEGIAYEEEFLANLHLIAAAPKLLRACKKAYRELMSGSSNIGTRTEMAIFIREVLNEAN